MSFPMSLALSCDHWPAKKCFGPILEGETFSVPLLYSYATSIRIKPSARKYKWSKAVSCGPYYQNPDEIGHNSDRLLPRSEIQCETTGVTKEYMSALMINHREEDRLLLSIEPYLQLTNLLPCQLSVICGGQSSTSADEDLTECYDVDAGAVYKFVSIPSVPVPQLSVRCGKLRWSVPYKLTEAVIATTSVVLAKRYTILLYNEANKLSLALSMTMEKSMSTGTIHLRVFSPYVVVDRTLRDLSVTGSVRGEELVRHTFRVGSSGRNDMSMPSYASYTQAESKAKGAPTNTAMNVSDMTVSSAHTYELKPCQLGALVYTDRDWTWHYMPRQLEGSEYIATAGADQYSRSRQLLQFQLAKKSIIVIMVDASVNRLPKWLMEDGYQQLVGQAIAHRTTPQGFVKTLNFNMHGRLCAGGNRVILKGNWSSDNGMMYAVCILPVSETVTLTSPLSTPRMASSKSLPIISSYDDVNGIFAQLNYLSSYDKAVSDKCWAEGAEGVTLFSTDLGVLTVGVTRGKAWSEAIPLPSPLSAGGLGFFEAVDWTLGVCYQLAMKTSFMPGAFSSTQVLSIMNRFVLVNHTDECLYVVQRGGRIQDAVVIPPYQAIPYHSSVHASLTTSLMFRTQSSIWSFGSVDISEIGSTVLYLPSNSAQSQASAAPSIQPTVVTIDVKLAEVYEKCSIVVAIGKASINTYMPFSIRNESDLPIVIRQAEVTVDIPGKSDLFDLCVPPGVWSPFGFTDPDVGGSRLLVTTGTQFQQSTAALASAGRQQRVATISLLNAGDCIRLPDASGRMGHQGELVLQILVSKRGGRVLRVFRQTSVSSAPVGFIGKVQGALTKSSHGFSSGDEEDDAALGWMSGELADDAPKTSPSAGLSVSMALSSVSVSVVFDKPVRREFMCMTVRGIEGRVETGGRVSSLEFTVGDVQVDNYSETRIYPVFIHR